MLKIIYYLQLIFKRKGIKKVKRKFEGLKGIS